MPCPESIKDFIQRQNDATDHATLFYYLYDLTRVCQYVVEEAI